MKQLLPPRQRRLYLLWIVIVIVAGLASRSPTLRVPWFAAKYAGDALWALMIFLGLGIVMPTRPTRIVAACAVVISVAVEFSQLYHAPWIDAARKTWPGRMALGDTFGWGDIAAYLVGISAGALLEWQTYRVHGRRLHAA